MRHFAFLLRCSLLTCAAIAAAAPGALDKTFSGDGISTIAINNREEPALGMVLQGNGHLVVVGGYDTTKRSEWFVSGVLPGGAKDNAFGFRFIGASGEKDDAYATAVALQSTGKIVVAGRIHNGVDYDSAVVRFLSTGQIDTTFGGTGVLIIPVAIGDDRLSAVTIDKFDRIVLGGFATGGTTGTDFAVMRLTPEGALDHTFNGTGKVTTVITVGNDLVSGLTTTSTAGIVAVGAAGQDFAVVRYLENGTPDTTFDGDGTALVSFGATTAAARSVVMQPDGAVVVAGRATINGIEVVALARLLGLDGSLDPQFGTFGKVTTEVGVQARANAVALQADGKIVVAGRATFVSDDFLVMRYNANGTLDLSFQGKGFATTNLGHGGDEASAVAIQPDGKIVAAGGSYRGLDTHGFQNVDVALVRYLGGEGLPPAIPASATEIGGDVTGATGSVFSAIDTPQPGAFGGAFKTGKTKTDAIFAADGSVRVQAGGAAPGLAQSVITKLGEPSGQAALATLKSNVGGVAAANDAILLGGLTAGPTRIAAREGTANAGLPAGVTIKSFGAIDGTGATIFFLATLQGTGVTPKTDAALCAALADGTVKVLVREGDPVDAKSVATIGALVAVKGTLAEGRWRAATDAIGVRLTFADKSHALYTIPAAAASPAGWTRWAATGDVLAGPRVASFGLPAFGADGPAVFTTLVVGEGGVMKGDDTALFQFDAGGFTQLAREGGGVPDATGVPIPDVTYKTLGEVVSGSQGRAAWFAKLAGSKQDDGVWWADATGTIRQLAREGGDAPGGGKWAKVSAIALPDGATSGPLLLATLAADKAADIAAGTTGLWAIDSTGALKLIVRTGQFVVVDGAARTLRSFTALDPAAGALGAASSYDDAGTVGILATFTDKTTALLRLVVP